MSGADRQGSSTGASEAGLASLYAALEGRETVREIAEILAPEGIDVVPLKGALLYALGCSDPLRRPMVDVDLLVRAADLDRTLSVLGRSGWTTTVRSPATVALQKEGRHLGVDLHHRLYAHHRFGPGVQRLLSRARADREAFGAPVRLPDPLDVYAHLVGHFAKERLDERQAEKLVDLARVAERFALDARTVAKHLEAEGLGRAARYTLAIARDHAGDAFAASVMAELRRDPLGTLLAHLARRAVRGLPQPSKRAAIPSAFLERTLATSVRALASHARELTERELRQRLAR